MNEVEDINSKLFHDGIQDGMSFEDELQHVWGLYIQSESSLKSSVEDKNQMLKQQSDDMKQVGVINIVCT
jgi:hypothetical protein